MTERERFADEDVAVSEVGVVMQVAAAESGRCHANLELIGSRRVELSRLLKNGQLPFRPP